MLRWTLGYTCLFPFWFPQCVCPAVGLLDHKAWTVVLEKTLESPLDCKKIQPVHSKGNQSWVFFGRTDAKAETPILWAPHVKSWLIGKASDAGRDWEQEEKGTTEDEMAGWHYRLDGHEFGWTLGVGDGQESLACCNSWGCKESDTTEPLNWTELNWTIHLDDPHSYNLLSLYIQQTGFHSASNFCMHSYWNSALHAFWPFQESQLHTELWCIRKVNTFSACYSMGLDLESHCQ